MESSLDLAKKKGGEEKCGSIWQKGSSTHHVEEVARRCVYFASLLMLRACSSFLNGAVCLFSLLAPLSFQQQKTDKEKERNDKTACALLAPPLLFCNRKGREREREREICAQI